MNVGHIKVTPFVTDHAYLQQKIQQTASISRLIEKYSLNSI